MTQATNSADETEWVSKTIIREAFNRGQFLERAERGELRHRVTEYNTHLNRRQRSQLGERKCTRSQLVAYYEPTGDLVALVHQYRRPDGSIRGRPDPKWLVYNNRRLAVRQAP
jgi:hypothetical protein